MADVGQREDPTRAYVYSVLFCFQARNSTNSTFYLAYYKGGKTLGRNIQLSPKVCEDPSANAMVCEPTASFPPPLLLSCSGLLITDTAPN